MSSGDLQMRPQPWPGPRCRLVLLSEGCQAKQISQLGAPRMAYAKCRPLIQNGGDARVGKSWIDHGA
jgi:hypothetical protein